MTAQQLADELLEIVVSSEPLAASLYGLPGHDHELADPSAAREQATAHQLAGLAERARALPLADLSDTDLATIGFTAHTAQVSADSALVPSAEFTIASGFYAPVPGLLQFLPRVALSTTDRAEGYLARLRALPTFLTTVGERHLSGVEAGRVGVQRLIQSTIDYLDAVLADPQLAGLSLDGPGSEQLSGFAEERDRLLNAEVRPALASYQELLREQVLPASRDDEHPGLCHLPGGPGFYAASSREHTGTSRTAQDLHAVGLGLIAEIAREMTELGPAAVGSADPSEIMTRLRNDPELRYQDAAQMMTDAEGAVRRAEHAAPSWFGRTPSQPCQIMEVPPAAAPGAPPAYYLAASLDGSRPSTYFLNTFHPEARGRHGAESMAFHEAVPGHHFQLSLAQEATGLPMAQRLLWDTASAEGWGLYAERLADEMGLYSSPLARLGMLGNDAWRAARLVVDTGLHALGWSRAQAVSFMQEHTAVPLLEIETEVDRYIGYPGQALAYMVGRLELLALRRRAREALGSGFDLRDFHDLVLGSGPMPLVVLSDVVDRWISRTATAAR